MKQPLKKSIGSKDSGAILRTPKGNFFHGGDKNAIGIRPVPVEEIFEIEAKLVRIGAREAKERERDYERYVSRLVDAVRKEQEDITVEAVRKQLGDDTITEVPMQLEAERLGNIIRIFRHELDAHYRGGTKLIESVATEEFNCYSSSVIVADALVRIGVPVGISTTLGHVALRTERYMVETAAHLKDSIRDIRWIARYYDIIYDVGMEKLPGVAWYSHGINLARYNTDEAIKAFDKALEIMPENVAVMFGRAYFMGYYSPITRWDR